MIIKGIIIIMIIIIIITTKDTTIKSHTGHCTHTIESANVKVQNIYHVLNNIIYSTNCKYRTVATMCNVETRCVSGI
jgi:hypothetical protein